MSFRFTDAWRDAAEFWSGLRPWQKLLMVFVGGALTVAMTLAGAWFWMDWAGRREYHQFLAEMKAKGEPTTLAELLPPPVPDDQNMAMIPLLRPLNDLVQDKNGRWVARDKEAQKKLEEMDVRDLATPNTKAPLPVSASRGHLTNLEPWARLFEPDDPSMTNQVAAARVVLRQLDRWNEPLSEFSKASQRPFLRSNIPMHARSAFVSERRFLGKLSQILKLRAICHARLGNSSASGQDLLIMLRVASKKGGEGPMMERIMEGALQSRPLGCLEEVLPLKTLQAEELEAVAYELEQLDHTVSQLSGQWVLSEAMIQRDSMKAYSAKLNQVMSPFPDSPRELFDAIRTDPGRLYRNLLWKNGGAWQANAANAWRNGIKWSSMVASCSTWAELKEIKKENAQWKESPRSWRNFILHHFHMDLQWVVDELRSEMETRSRVRLARVAVALERSRLQHGKYPEDLAQLVPEWLDSVPADPCSDAPMRYRLEPNGEYTLWFNGPDGDDDGGRALNLKGEYDDADSDIRWTSNLTVKPWSPPPKRK